MVNCSKTQTPHGSRAHLFQSHTGFGSVDSRCIPLRAVRCVSSSEQPGRPAAAAADFSPGLQEHTELAGKWFEWAAGVNNLPYALVGVPALSCNVH